MPRRRLFLPAGLVVVLRSARVVRRRSIHGAVALRRPPPRRPDLGSGRTQSGRPGIRRGRRARRRRASGAAQRAAGDLTRVVNDNGRRSPVCNCWRRETRAARLAI